MLLSTEVLPFAARRIASPGPGPTTDYSIHSSTKKETSSTPSMRPLRRIRKVDMKDAALGMPYLVR